jgi:hypothetical protein
MHAEAQLDRVACGHSLEAGATDDGAGVARHHDPGTKPELREIVDDFRPKLAQQPGKLGIGPVARDRRIDQSLRRRRDGKCLDELWRKRDEDEPVGRKARPVQWTLTPCSSRTPRIIPSLCSRALR